MNKIDGINKQLADEMKANKELIIETIIWDYGVFKYSYQFSEEIKSYGRVYQNDVDIRVIVKGYLLESFGHYLRSVDSSLENVRYHPGFTRYFQHWFHSDPDYIKNELATSIFNHWFDKPTDLKIKKGSSYYIH